jgi:hypothetical protein
VSGRSTAKTALLRWQSTWRLYLLGDSQRQIARTLGISLSTVQHYLGKGEPPHGQAFPYGIRNVAKRPTYGLTTRPTSATRDPFGGSLSGSLSESETDAMVVQFPRIRR